MKKLIMVLVLVASLFGTAYADNYESVTVADTAVGLTKSNFLPPDSYNDRAFITVETASIRFRLDGTAPTTSEGHLLNAGDTLVLEGREVINNFKAIRTTATSATIKVSYYMEG